MILHKFYHALGNRRGFTFGSVYNALVRALTGTSSSIPCYIQIGAGNDDIPFTSDNLEYPYTLGNNVTRTAHSVAIRESGTYITVTDTFSVADTDITVKEVGIKYQDNENMVLTRDVLATPVLIPAGTSHTFTLSIRMKPYTDNDYGWMKNLYKMFDPAALTDKTGRTIAMSSVSRSSDIYPVGCYDTYYDNDSRFGYGSSRAWWIDVGFSDMPATLNDYRGLIDGNNDRILAERTDVLTCNSMTDLNQSETDDLIMEKLQAVFTNNTASPLTVKEIAMYFRSGYYDDYRYYCMYRKLITPVTINPGDSHTFIESITWEQST